MDAIKSNIQSILDGSRQFIVPIYQRTYSWGRTQCDRLWNDIVNMINENKSGHFVGSVVNIIEQALPAGVQKYTVIDGQQRMTTFTILMIALRDYLYNNPDVSKENPEKINSVCIVNQFESDDDRYKMLLTKGDRENLKKLIDRAPYDQLGKSRIRDAYEFFYDKINKTELTVEEIQNGIAKLQIVNITLDRQFDDPQLIFESLNSTGMDLTQSDLIRNHILMGLTPDQQNKIYNSYWYPIEEMFADDRQNNRMDFFFRDYLTCRNKVIPTFSKIHEEFRTYYRNNGKENPEEFSKNLYRYAKYYTDMYFCKCKDEELNSVFSEISELKMDVSFPFLMKVYMDYDDGLIDKKVFIEILRLCESYVFRRSVMGIPTNSLNKTFAMMIKDVDTEDYLNSVKAFLVLLESYKVFPGDGEFRNELMTKDLYNTRTCGYLLRKFENYDNKAKIAAGKYSIEHIMPQTKNLNKEWKDALGDNYGDVQAKYLHTLGNLTLTAYNPEMSCNSFKEKLDCKGGFKESALRLNSYIVKQTVWNEETIKERASLLADLALKIWSYPSISEEELKPYMNVQSQEEEYSLDHYEHLNGEMLKLYNLLDARIRSIAPDIRCEYKKNYIAYKADTNFVDIVPQKSRLRLTINMKYSEVIDKKGICEDVTDKGRWGNGDIIVPLHSETELDDVMDIVIQSYEKQADEN